MPSPPARSLSAARRAGVWVGALAGLLLALVAAWPGGARGGGMPARLLVVALPAWAPEALIAAMAAAVLALVASLLPQPHRKDPDAPEREPPPPPHLSPWVLVALLLAMALAVAAILWAAGLVPPPGGAPATPAPIAPPPLSPSAPAAAPLPAPALVPVLAPVLTGLLAALAVVLALTSAWLVWENRWVMVHAPRRRRARLAQAMAAAARAGEQALRRGGDARATVIACYRRCERAVKATGRWRYSWQTPREYLAAAMATLDLPPDAVATLLGCFERARYGAAPVPAADQAAALRAMAAIRAALARRTDDARGAPDD